ncbi:unnamed protein product [Lymnaea stagnalis]|uniref:Hexosyltransferase n=1 Tax=Lymnaea stagnalis TaxID=6523 RepID=A0AAV2HY29_LYMST
MIMLSYHHGIKIIRRRGAETWSTQTLLFFIFVVLLCCSMLVNFIFLFKSPRYRSKCPHFTAELYQMNDLRNEVAELKNMVTFLAEPAITDHNYTYLLNPKNACREPLELLIVVPSAPGNFARRMKVRQSSRADYANDPKNKARLVFFLGRQVSEGNDLETQLSVDEEAEKYGDIVQEDFVDVYRNIRLKAMSMLKWASTYCPRTRFVLRTDDDIRTNIPKTVAAMKRASQRLANFILGLKEESTVPVRRSQGVNSKYFISYEEYPEATFPPFAYGGLLGYPISTVKLLYQASLRVKPIWLDDVFITGLCAPKVNVALLSDPDIDFEHHAW